MVNDLPLIDEPSDNCCPPDTASSADAVVSPSQASGRAYWVGLFSGIAALLGGIGCCGLPLLTATLGTVGIGSTFFTILQPYQPFFIGLAVSALGFEFFKAYRPSPVNTCCTGASKTKKVMLWSTLVVLTALISIQASQTATATSGQSGESGTGVGACCEVESTATSQPSCCSTDVESTASSGHVVFPVGTGDSRSCCATDVSASSLPSCCPTTTDSGDFDAVQSAATSATPAECCEAEAETVKSHTCCPESSNAK